MAASAGITAAELCARHQQLNAKEDRREQIRLVPQVCAICTDIFTRLEEASYTPHVDYVRVVWLPEHTTRIRRMVEVTLNAAGYKMRDTHWASDSDDETEHHAESLVYWTL